MSQHIFTLGGAAWDVLFTTPEAELIEAKGTRHKYLAFPYGGKLDAREITYGFGGGAANVAVALARLGNKTSIITRVGSDWRGSEVVKNLKRNKVLVDHIQVDKRSTTALSFIVTTGGPRDHVAFVARGASTNLVIPSHFSASSWLYVTSLATSTWAPQLERLLKTLRKQDTKIFWNPGATQLARPQAVRKLLKYVDILDLNRAEAEYLVRDLKLKDCRVSEVAKVLVASGARSVVITDGPRGAYFYDGKKLTHQKSLNDKPTNTTGAGDAFGSGFLGGYVASKGNIAESLRWGMLSATSVILNAGAQVGLPTRAEILKLYRKHF